MNLGTITGNPAFITAYQRFDTLVAREGALVTIDGQSGPTPLVSVPEKAPLSIATGDDAPALNDAEVTLNSVTYPAGTLLTYRVNVADAGQGTFDIRIRYQTLLSGQTIVQKLTKAMP